MPKPLHCSSNPSSPRLNVLFESQNQSAYGNLHGPAPQFFQPSSCERSRLAGILVERNSSDAAEVPPSVARVTRLTESIVA